MSQTVGRVLDIVSVMGVLGLLLRWGPEAARLIGATGAASSDFFRTVSLQGITAPADRAPQ